MFLLRWLLAAVPIAGNFAAGINSWDRHCYFGEIRPAIGKISA